MKPGPVRVDQYDPQPAAFNLWLMRHKGHVGRMIVVKLAGATVKREAYCETCAEPFRVPA